jgi:DNA-binding MarR family transcriptional regulator
VQASTAPAQLDDYTQELLPDLAAFVRFIMQTCGRDFFQAVGELELSFSQVKVLQVLADEPDDISVKGLADRLGLSLPAMSRAVDDLVRRELVTRTEDAEDRRMKRVRATAAGRRLLGKLIELRIAGLSGFLETLKPAERARLHKALAPIVAREDIAPLRPRRS